MRKLSHTGNVSVQLQPPGSGNNDRAETPQAEERQQQSFAFNFPEQRFDIAIPEQSAPVVNVGAPVVNVPEFRMDAPVVNVSPTPVTIDNTVNVEPTPVTVENSNNIAVAPAKVPAAQVTVMPAEPDGGRSTFKVKRDRDGRITEVVED